MRSSLALGDAATSPIRRLIRHLRPELKPRIAMRGGRFAPMEAAE